MAQIHYDSATARTEQPGEQGIMGSEQVHLGDSESSPISVLAYKGGTRLPRSPVHGPGCRESESRTAAILWKLALSTTGHMAHVVLFRILGGKETYSREPI